jgi:hypothetical protein
MLSLLLVLALGACDALEEAGAELGQMDNVQIGFVESSGLNNTEARFHTLSGRKSWRERLGQGDRLTLAYEVTLDKGSLTLQVQNPQDEAMWQVELEEGADVDDEVVLDAGESGTYTIVVLGDGAGGNYDLSWEQSE